MKKILLSFFMLVACMATAWAEEVTFDFKGNPWGLTLGSGTGATAEAGDVTEIVQDSVVLTFDQGTASTPARMWTGPQLRVYTNSTMTMTAPEGKVITKVVWTATGASYNKLSVDGTEIVAADGWTGSASSVTFTVTANKHNRFYSAVVTLEEEEVDNVVTPIEPDKPVVPEDSTETDEPTVELNTFLDETFASSQGEFTLNDVALPEGSTYVWKLDTSYGCMKATAYVSGTTYASESWLISPVVDLTGATNCVLSFEQAANFFGDQATYLAAVSVKAKAEGATEWTDLAVEGAAEGTSWTFVPSTASLAAFDGQKVQIAFVYTSTTEKAGTWEVKNVTVKGEGGNVAPEPVTPVYTSIMDLKDNATAEKVDVEFQFKDLLVTAVSGKSVYVTDGNAGTLLYGSGYTCVAGDKVSGTVTGQLCLYNGLTEITGVDYTNMQVVSSGNDVVATKLTIKDITDNMGYWTYENMLVNLDSVYFAAETLTNKNVNISDAPDANMVLRDNFNVLTEVIFKSKPYNVTGVVSHYNGTPQLYIISADDVKVISTLEEATTAWESAEVVILPGEVQTVSNVATTTSDAAIVYSSSDEAVATVDAEGNITVVGYGLAEISAETVETENFLSSKATFTLYVIEGDGTFEKPYNVADVKYYYEKVTDKVWVKGTILGNYTNDGVNADLTSAVASNLAIGTGNSVIPVQLSSGSDVRKTLNLVDNPDKLGTEVILYGNIEKYFSTAGLKSVTDGSLDGESTITAIESVKADTNKEQVIYSISGQRLSQPVKGINIINGKKVIVK